MCIRDRDNGAGIVISTDNVAAQLKTIIPILVEHPSFTKDLGEKARERVLERYTITKKSFGGTCYGNDTRDYLSNKGK